MISNSTVRIIVGSNFLRPVAATYERSALLSLFLVLLALRLIEQLCLEQAHGSGPIFVLRALVLAFNNDAGGKVG